LFGSNHPAWPAEDCLQDLDSLGLSPEGIELFLCANAERVFALTKWKIEASVQLAAGAG
jgi:predicted TIM-barrel fold metal-dependent hydrolase